MVADIFMAGRFLYSHWKSWFLIVCNNNKKTYPLGSMGDNCDLNSIDKALENGVFSFNPNSALLYTEFIK